MTKAIYPEWFSSKDKIADKFEYSNINVGSYAEDFEEAYKVAKKKKGEVYTQIDGDGSEVVYEKGTHYVNRIGVVVLVRTEE